MIVMIPLMLAARKLDGEDPDVVFMLRCAYGAVQGLILLAVLYVYMVATKISKSKLKDEEIFVSPPAQVCHTHNIIVGRLHSDKMGLFIIVARCKIKLIIISFLLGYCIII